MGIYYSNKIKNKNSFNKELKAVINLQFLLLVLQISSSFRIIFLRIPFSSLYEYMWTPV